MRTTAAAAAASPAVKEEAMEEEKNNMFLTEDIVIKILQNLPLRSLARANCVSKLWHSHISTKSLFLHAPCSSPLFHGFFFQSSNIPKNGVPIHFFSSIPNPPLPYSLPIHLLASSNGLLLCGTSNRNPIVKYLVWNPTSSNRLISIPKPMNLFTSVKIGFHSDDPLCFTILRFGILGFTWMEIFSSERGDWSRLAVNFPIHSLIPPFEGPPAAVLHGVFYWLEFRSLIYAFDLLNNEFVNVEFPPEDAEFRRNVFSRCLSVAGGALQMASTDGECVEIWVLKRDSWAFKCRFSVETLFGNYANTLCASSAVAGGCRFVGIVGFQPSDSERIFLNTTEIVICCDLRSGKIEIVHRFDGGLRCTDVCDFMFFPYESYDGRRPLNLQM